jgi:hypothetical protein
LGSQSAPALNDISTDEDFLVEPGLWTEIELIFSLDQLNSFFTSTQNRATSNRRVENNASLDQFDFSNSIGSGGIKRSSSNHNFNTILTTSIYPSAWKTSKIKLIAAAVLFIHEIFQLVSTFDLSA